MAGVLNPIDAQLCAPGANAASDGKCPINDTELKYDADAVQVLTWTLLSYPSTYMMLTVNCICRTAAWMYLGCIVGLTHDTSRIHIHNTCILVSILRDT